MPKDRFLQSAASYADMGRSNERFIADSNRRLIADLRVRTGDWGKRVVDEARTNGMSNMEVFEDHVYFDISHQEFMDARERNGKFPWWQTHYVLGPLSSAQIMFDESVDSVDISSTFRSGSYLKIGFLDDDVTFRASSFRKKGNSHDAMVWKQLGAHDPGGLSTPYDLFIDKKPFERVELALEVLDWVNDLVDLRRNPRQE